jgi:hypothetical protein
MLAGRKGKLIGRVQIWCGARSTLLNSTLTGLNAYKTLGGMEPLSAQDRYKELEMPTVPQYQRQSQTQTAPVMTSNFACRKIRWCRASSRQLIRRSI